MSKHRKFPEITKSDSHLSQEYFKFKPKRQMAPLQNQPAPIIIKPSINHSSHHTKQSSFLSDSPYARSKSLTKIRSSSAIKLNDKSPIKLRSISPEMKKNASNSRIQLKLKNRREISTITLSKQSNNYIDSIKKRSKSRTPAGINLSFSNSFTAPTQDSQRILNQSNNDAENLETKLLAKLKEITKNEEDSIMDNDKFNVYRKIFVEVIEKDKTYGSLLAKIKNAYEEWISIEKTQENNLSLKQEANDLNEKIKELLEDRKLIYRKIEKLAKENIELSRSLEESEAGYAELHDKLLLISKTKIDDIPKDENSWKYVVAENKILADLCKQMKDELKKFRSKEKKLLKLIIALKNRGYPVEEVYETEILKRKSVQEEKPHDRESGETDGELLVSGPSRKVEKPSFIPILELSNIKHYISSSESSDNSDAESESES
ncbi:unnamed protein product [Blepharisma stoltei]|uniref:Translin-associated factor X-interacting protein 1 N-terminal domain-containing protein n=1 Tax=Blepharisma stoltei TaxID=1481888 RepID=A0AAU9KBS3_9CILI|nr:unnamed protein product [Blepharisma stoltei]